MSIWTGGKWLNEPKQWREVDDALEVTTDAASDFWRETHYGFTRDSGHLLGFEAPSAFTAQVRVKASYETLYDQAGLMVRVDEKRWLKAGIELSDGHAMLGSVLTVDVSDWATGRYQHDPHDFWLRITVAEGVLRLQASADGLLWPIVRLAPFPLAESYRVGPMCCTPERAGLVVSFSEFQLTPPLGKALHDLT